MASSLPRHRGHPGGRAAPVEPTFPSAPSAPISSASTTSAGLVNVPLWVLVGGRSGDKGGDANVGLWADSDVVAEWLLAQFDTTQFKETLAEAAPFEIRRYPLANLRAVNFVIHGYLGWGVASNLRLDTQAKGLAERLRSRYVLVPADLISAGRPAERFASLTDAGRDKFDGGMEIPVGAVQTPGVAT